MITHVHIAFSIIKTIERAEDLLGHVIQHRRPNAQLRIVVRARI